LSFWRSPSLGVQQKSLRNWAKTLKTKKKIQLIEGRFGAYAKIGMMNLSLPKGFDVNKATAEDILKIRDEKKSNKK
jgi:DNA topoisomerase-1